MDAKELRIGNFIEPLTKSPCIITGINYQKVKDGDVIFVYADYESFLPEHILPIPITEEWLLKFGFEKTDLKPYRDQLAWVIGVDAARLIWSAHRIFKPLPDGFICVCINCEYVHQLQNYYFASENTELKS